MIHFYAKGTKWLALSDCVRLIPLIVFFSLTLSSWVSADERKTVIATTSLIGDIASILGGAEIDVSSLMGPGIDPHTYKASPGDLRKLSRASLILHNGLHLEGKLSDALEQLSKRKLVVSVSASIPREKLRFTSSDGQIPDPHIWFDVRLWTEAAREIASAIQKIDPSHGDTYTTRLAELSKKLEELHIWCERTIATLPLKRRVLITAHDAFGYFGRAFNFEVIGIQGINTESEASLRGINALVDILVERKIPAVFIESTVSPKTVEALIEGTQARGHSVRIGGELYSDALGDPGSPSGSYEGMIKHNITTIVEALNGP